MEVKIINKGDIFICDNKELIYKMVRRTPIPFKTIGEIFQNEKKIAEVIFSVFYIKIIYQNFLYNVKIINQKFFMVEFNVDGNVIRITHNPFFYFNKKKFSKIYFNSELTTIVSMKKILDIEGYNLELNFLKEDKLIKDVSIICFIIYCIELNLS